MFPTRLARLSGAAFILHSGANLAFLRDEILDLACLTTKFIEEKHITYLFNTKLSHIEIQNSPNRSAVSFPTLNAGVNPLAFLGLTSAGAAAIAR